MLYVLGFPFELRDIIMDECKNTNVSYVKLQYYSKKDLVLGYLKYYLLHKAHIPILGPKVYNLLLNVKESDKILIWGGGECLPLQYAILHALKFRTNNNYIYNWDIVNEAKYNLTKNIQKYFKYYSYDRGDVSKFGFTYKEQLTYNPDPIVENYNIQNSLYFCGRDKGRYKKIEEIVSILQKEMLSYDITCIRDKTSPDKMISAINTTKIVSFLDNIINIKKSKCVLELLGEGHVSVSLRAFEALLCKRKLITDCKDIVNEKFYDPSNIFILGVDTDLVSFINKPFNDTIKYDFSSYLINRWINTFLEDK